MTNSLENLVLLQNFDWMIARVHNSYLFWVGNLKRGKYKIKRKQQLKRKSKYEGLIRKKDVLPCTFQFPPLSTMYAFKRRSREREREREAKKKDYTRL